eukprot:snap_masked-scaffold_33-processed-gene-2.38-mRNA-1 protein AED:1.00 eAED:1.00 QI:0/0/0/0/1/1/2/0/106
MQSDRKSKNTKSGQGKGDHDIWDQSVEEVRGDNWYYTGSRKKHFLDKLNTASAILRGNKRHKIDSKLRNGIMANFSEKKDFDEVIENMLVELRDESQQQNLNTVEQ